MHCFLSSAYKRKHTQILVDTADLQKKNEASTACQRSTWLSARQTGQKTRNGTQQNVRWLLYQLILRLCDISGLSFSFSLSLSQNGGVREGEGAYQRGVCLSACVCEGTDGSVVMWCVSRGMFDGLMLSSSIAMYHLISLPPSASIKPAWLLISASLSVSPLSVCLSLSLFSISSSSQPPPLQARSYPVLNKWFFHFFFSSVSGCVCTVAGTHTQYCTIRHLSLLLRALHFFFIKSPFFFSFLGRGSFLYTGFHSGRFSPGFFSVCGRCEGFLVRLCDRVWTMPRSFLVKKIKLDDFSSSPVSASNHHHHHHHHDSFTRSRSSLGVRLCENGECDA